MKLVLEFPAVVSAIRRIENSGGRLYKRFIGILPPGIFPVLLEHAVLWVKFRTILGGWRKTKRSAGLEPRGGQIGSGVKNEPGTGAEQKRLRVFVFSVWGFAPNAMTEKPVRF
jgi:hypothetical protein